MDFTSSEMMTITASRFIRNNDVCFVGIGMPSSACNLARLTHAPDVCLIYESGTIGAKPDVLPLSIGDGELCETAVTTVSVPEMFRYWLQGGKITVGFLGAAQIDKYGNINTTIVGDDYHHPKVRLPGGGGAPEIASSSHEIYLIMKQTKRSFVENIDFVTSLGHGLTGKERVRYGLSTKGPTRLITDLCVMESDPVSHEFIVVSVHPGVSKSLVLENTGWDVQFSETLTETSKPTLFELDALRKLNERTAKRNQATID